MLCPMSFRTSLHPGDAFECDPNCAWAIKQPSTNRCACAIALSFAIAIIDSDEGIMNSEPSRNNDSDKRPSNSAG